MSAPRHPGFGNAQRLLNLFWVGVGAVLAIPVLIKLQTHQPISSWSWARLGIGGLVFLAAVIAVVQDLRALSRTEKS